VLRTGQLRIIMTNIDGGRMSNTADEDGDDGQMEAMVRGHQAWATRGSFNRVINKLHRATEAGVRKG